MALVEDFKDFIHFVRIFRSEIKVMFDLQTTSLIFKYRWKISKRNSRDISFAIGTSASDIIIQALRGGELLCGSLSSLRATKSPVVPIVFIKIIVTVVIYHIIL
jgi:hypothetical protein